MKTLTIFYLKQMARTPASIAFAAIMIGVVPMTFLFYSGTGEMAAGSVIMIICVCTPWYAVSANAREEFYLALPVRRIQIFVARYIASVVPPVIAALVGFAVIAPLLTQTPALDAAIVLVNIVCGIAAVQATVFLLMNLKGTGTGEIRPIWVFIAYIIGLPLTAVIFAGPTLLPAVIFLPCAAVIAEIAYCLYERKEIAPANEGRARQAPIRPSMAPAQADRWNVRRAPEPAGREVAPDLPEFAPQVPVGASVEGTVYPGMFMLGPRLYWRGLTRSLQGIGALALALMSIAMNAPIGLIFVLLIPTMLLSAGGPTCRFLFASAYGRKRIFAAYCAPLVLYLICFAASTVYSAPSGSLFLLAFHGFSESEASQFNCSVQHHSEYNKKYPEGDLLVIVDPHGYKRILSPVSLKGDFSDKQYDPYESNENDPPTFVAYQVQRYLKDKFGADASEEEILAVKPPLPKREPSPYSDNAYWEKSDWEQNHRDWLKNIDNTFRDRMADGLRRRALATSFATVPGVLMVLAAMFFMQSAMTRAVRIRNALARVLGGLVVLGIVMPLFFGLAMPNGFLQAPAARLADWAVANAWLSLAGWLVVTAGLYLLAQRLFCRTEVTVFEMYDWKRNMRKWM